MSTDAASGDNPRKLRRMDRRDPRLPLAEMFDPVIAQTLWDSLPADCRVDHIDKKNIPEVYRGAITPKSSGKRGTTVYVNFRDLPEPMTQEIAWLIHREIELGRFIKPNMFNSATRALRIATKHGTSRGRNAASLLHLAPDEWVREVQAARMRGIEIGANIDTYAFHRLRQMQDVLVYPYHRGQWWELDVWNPQLDPRIPQREHEPSGRHVVNFSHLTSQWLREGAKLWLSASLSNGTLTWSSIKARVDNLKWLQRHRQPWRRRTMSDHRPAPAPSVHPKLLRDASDAPHFRRAAKCR